MSNSEIKNIDTIAKFSNFQVINKDFTRCRCNIFYTGRNRNHWDITEEALNNLIERKGYANVPVVAHLIKDSDGNYRVGGHDLKIIISDEKTEIVDECVPFGVIPEDCNPSMDLITERSGEQRKYFSVDVILWTHRYPIMEAAYSDEIYFNQSMEITYDNYTIDEDGYSVVKEFSLSALCLLNRSSNTSENVEPCFESSAVKKFSVDKGAFKKNFEIMLEKLKSYELEDNSKNEQKGEKTMDFSRITEKLSAYTYKNAVGETVSKYSLIDATENSIGVVDREDNKIYSFDYADADNEIVIDMDSKTECSMTFKAMPEKGSFDYSNEIAIAQKTREMEISKSFSDEYNAKIDEITNAYTQLKADYDSMTAEYEKYKAADEARIEKEKHTQIDAIVDKYAKKIGRLPKFLCYRAKIDYSKSAADIENELILMAGEAMMDTSRQNFSYNPTITSISGSKSEKYSHSDRYGNLFDKFIND